MEWAHAILGQAMIAIWFAPTSRTFLPFIIVALMLAGGAALATSRSRTALRPEQKLFSRATWLSRSAINDYGLVLVNALIIGAIGAAIIPDEAALSQAIASGLWSPAGSAAMAYSLWLALLLSACLFVVDDFIRYVSHYAEHRVPMLWELHKVHHSATALNFMTAERHHPVAIIIFQMLRVIGVVGVNSGFYLLFGDHVSPLGWLGGNVFWMASNLIGGTLRHSPVWISFGPTIERWLISPAQHQIHHSDDPKHFDCNFGGSLAVWDRMFGTLYVTTPVREDIRFGLGADTSDYDSLASLYWRPLRGIGERLVARDRQAPCVSG